MTVLDVLELDQDDDRITATALVDDADLRWAASPWSPAEPCAAVCSTTILLGEPFDASSLDDEALKRFLEETALDWKLVDTSDW